MTPTAATAALTLSLTGKFARQGGEAAQGIRLWADDRRVQVDLVDDGGRRAAAVEAYGTWLGRVDLLIGPYASGLVRALVPLVREAGQLLWNHGGSADDLAQPGIVSLPAPASSYFHRAVDEAANLQVDRLIIVQGPGPFARAVADGAAARAAERGLDARTIEASKVEAEEVTGTALLTVGPFEHDAEVVRSVHRRRKSPVVLGAVAAGIAAFGQELGEAAEDVIGPVQWWPSTRTPEIGPSGADFVVSYQRRTGHEPSYPAAQAAAAGYLAQAAQLQRLTPEDIQDWKTSTLLGDFALDSDWRQIGHHVETVRWQDGRMMAVEGSV